jgi:hypothetical protein
MFYVWLTCILRLATSCLGYKQISNSKTRLKKYFWSLQAATLLLNFNSHFEKFIKLLGGGFGGRMPGLLVRTCGSAATYVTVTGLFENLEKWILFLFIIISLMELFRTPVTSILCRQWEARDSNR